MLSDCIKKYLEKSRDSKAKGTYNGEVSIANSCMRCLEQINIRNTDDLKYESVQEIIKYYKTFTRCKNSSINKYTAYIKAVLRDSGFKTHPFLLTKKLRDDTKHTKVIERKDLIKIMQYAMDLKKNKNSIVYRTVIFLLYETGARINELLNIKIRNINIQERWIMLDTTKNHKNRVVPYSHLSSLVIEELIKKNPQKEFLFWNLIRKRQLQYNDVKLFLRDMMDDIDIKHVHPHMFRKTMATTLVEKGANTKTAQKILGHESIVTTKLYVDYHLRVAMMDYKQHDISKGVVSAIENHNNGLSSIHFAKMRS